MGTGVSGCCGCGNGRVSWVWLWAGTVGGSRVGVEPAVDWTSPANGSEGVGGRATAWRGVHGGWTRVALVISGFGRMESLRMWRRFLEDVGFDLDRAWVCFDAVIPWKQCGMPVRRPSVASRVNASRTRGWWLLRALDGFVLDRW